MLINPSMYHIWISLYQPVLDMPGPKTSTMVHKKKSSLIKKSQPKLEIIKRDNNNPPDTKLCKMGTIKIFVKTISKKVERKTTAVSCTYHIKSKQFGFHLLPRYWYICRCPATKEKLQCNQKKKIRTSSSSIKTTKILKCKSHKRMEDDTQKCK